MTSALARRFATLATATVLAFTPMAVVSANAAQAAPTGSTATTVDKTERPVQADKAAGGWVLVGVFPDPLSCSIAGATTGRSFFCGFYFVFWGLNVWQD
jgi:hypothetical protein